MEDIQTAPEQELILNPPPLLAKPVVIISQTMVGIMRGDMKAADNFVISTDEDYKLAASLVNHMGKTGSVAKKSILDLGKPYRDAATAITERGNQFVNPYAASAAALGDRMSAYKIKRDNEVAKALAEEQRRLDAEAETKRLAEVEQKRLQDEADQRMKLATKDLKTATTEEQFADAGEKFDKGLAVQGQAAAVGQGALATPALQAAAAPLAPAPEGPTVPEGYTAVVSSYLNAVKIVPGVSAQVCDLLVQFKDGAVANYPGVPELTCKMLLKSESCGKFFLAQIKGRFESFPVSGPTVARVPARPAGSSPVPVALGKAKGVRESKTPVILTVDISKLPLQYHMPDEVKIKNHILDGTITKGKPGFPDTPGITFEIKVGFSGTGR